MKIEENAGKVIKRLEAAGHAAYLVGGCVRDFLLGQEPQDWDVATSATPEEVLVCFADGRVLETGLKHGTVTVLLGDMPVEVTTFREDGHYLDNRRPERVTFVEDLKKDLARRDFTINAMACHPDKGLTDCFGGEADLRARRIRTVGNPDRRLKEDGLRILRALRFAATLDFEIDQQLSAAIHRNKDLLAKISAERIASELMKMLPGKRISDILTAYPDVFSVFIPEISPAVGFDQKNPHHGHDVWGHTALSIEKSVPDSLTRLTLLFHDLGKPKAFFLDKKGIGHFYGHEGYSAEIANSRLRAMKFDKDTVEKVTELIRWHDAIIEESRILRWLNRLGEAQLRRLFEIKIGDAAAHTEGWQSRRFAEIATLREALDRVLTEGRCFSLRDLAINGDDLIAIGLPEGGRIGETLDRLLKDVMEDRLPNERDALLKAAHNHISPSDF
jgi:tRNA nucleotidyltransferase (CCA-adding enzyme)